MSYFHLHLYVLPFEDIKQNLTATHVVAGGNMQAILASLSLYILVVVVGARLITPEKVT